MIFVPATQEEVGGGVVEEEEGEGVEKDGRVVLKVRKEVGLSRGRVTSRRQVQVQFIVFEVVVIVGDEWRRERVRASEAREGRRAGARAAEQGKDSRANTC